MNNYDEKVEKNLIEMVKQKEEADKRLLKLEMVIGYTASITFLGAIFVASYIEMPTWLRVLLIVGASIIFAVGMHNSLRIEQTAGYYECAKCHHKYVPTYKSVFSAMHRGRTRYMRCPECHQKSWQKKVISKE